MPGELPGIPGVIAFVGIKFAGYFAAGVLLKKLHPDIKRKPWQIAAMRTGIGVVTGPILTIMLVQRTMRWHPNSDPSYSLIYGSLAVLRFLIWLVVISWAAKGSSIPRGRKFIYAFVGMLWSCLLDLPGWGLAVISPGKIPIC